MDDDERLLRRVEQALTEIKIEHGLSDRHASVLAALRIRLKGDPGKSLDEMLEAAGDLSSGGGLDDLLAQEQKPVKSLDDLLREKKPKPEWPS